MVCTKSFTLYEITGKFTVNLHFQSFVVKLDLIKQSMKKKVKELCMAETVNLLN